MLAAWILDLMCTVGLVVMQEARASLAASVGTSLSLTAQTLMM